jgi:predicted site-specific integrase-resolvase
MRNQPLCPPLNVKKFAAAAKLSERTIWRLLAAGKILVIRRTPGRVEIPPSEVERLRREGVRR